MHIVDQGIFFFYQDGGIKVTLLCELNKFEFPPGGGGSGPPLEKTSVMVV